MTVKEFLEAIGWNRVFYNSEIEQYKLSFQFIQRMQYPYDDQETEVEQSIKKLDIDNNNKTITFKN